MIKENAYSDIVGRLRPTKSTGQFLAQGREGRGASALAPDTAGKNALKGGEASPAWGGKERTPSTEIGEKGEIALSLSARKGKEKCLLPCTDGGRRVKRKRESSSKSQRGGARKKTDTPDQLRHKKDPGKKKKESPAARCLSPERKSEEKRRRSRSPVLVHQKKGGEGKPIPKGKNQPKRWPRRRRSSPDLQGREKKREKQQQQPY